MKQNINKNINNIKRKIFSF